METNVPVTRILDVLPKQIDSYKILDKLGKGGMGVVYKVEKNPGEIYALKILLDKDASEEIYFQRFRKEIEILCQFNHPNIVKIHSMGVWQGKPYFIMDYLEGVTLGKYLKTRQKLLPKEALSIFYPIACALIEVHKIGIVHRDIKPDNIMICNKKPYLMDFGVALEYNRKTRMTATGVAIGTLNYMPPEQVQGQKKKIGPWSDVYSLGATLHHTLTGVVPFFGHTEFETMLRLSQEEISSIKKYNTRFSKELEWIVQHATRKNHEERYSAMQEFAEDMNSILNQKKITKKRNTYKTRFLLPYMLLFVILIALSFVVMFYVSQGKEQAREIPKPKTQQIPIDQEKPKPVPLQFSEKKAQEDNKEQEKNLQSLKEHLKKSIEQKEDRGIITQLTLQIADIYKKQNQFLREVELLEECPYPDIAITERRFHLHLQMQRNSYARYDLFLLKEIFHLQEQKFLPLLHLLQESLKQEDISNQNVHISRQKIRKILKELAFINAAKWTVENPLVQEAWKNAFQIAQENFDDFMPLMTCLSSLIALKDQDLAKAKQIMNITFSGQSFYSGFAWLNLKGVIVFDFWPEITFVNAILAYYSNQDEKARHLLEKFQTNQEYYDYPTERRLYKMAEPYLKSLQNKNSNKIPLESNIIKELLKQLLYRLGDRILKTSIDMIRTQSIATAIDICEDFLCLEYWEYMFHYKLGYYYSLQKNIYLAEQNFLIAKKYKPDFSELIFLLGEIYLYTNRLQQAKESFTYCVQNQPQWDKYMLEKAKQYLLEIEKRNKK